jgi:UDP-3-O-[3-hydroxymyristoyl] glucosamine N-acyltransferase
LYCLQSLLDKNNIHYRAIGGLKVDEFDKIAPLEDHTEFDLTYINRPQKDILQRIPNIPARLILIPSEWGMDHQNVLQTLPKSFMMVDNPRLVVAILLKNIIAESAIPNVGIHPSAIIHSKARLGDEVCVGPYSIIGNCIIGDRTCVGAHTIIKDRVIVGNDVTIKEFCLIGGSGFGFVRNNSKFPIHIPHMGSVIIEDSVEIFPFTNIDRGTFGATKIGRGTKIDHYVHIGHNSIVGENCIITAGTVMCGSSQLGSRSWTGVNSVIKESTVVGTDATLGISAVVLNAVQNGETVVGVPAKLIQRR